MVVCLLGWAWVSALGAAADAETRGMIISRTGETLILSTSTGEKVTVVLTDQTVTKDDRGLFGLDKEHMGSTVLIPGLKVKVDGTTDSQGRVVAKTITTDGDDLETAEMIQAGLHPTAQQVNSNMQAIEHLQKKAGMTQEEIAANKQANAANQQNISAHEQQIQQSMKDIEENSDRFKALSEYDVKGQATVNFNVGSAKLSATGEEELKKIAQTATGLNRSSQRNRAWRSSSSESPRSSMPSSERTELAAPSQPTRYCALISSSVPATVRTVAVTPSASCVNEMSS